MQFHNHRMIGKRDFLPFCPLSKPTPEIQFRRLPLERREEAVQEAIAGAVVAYRRLAVQGRLHVAHPGTIATNAVHHVRNGRHVGGGQDAARDVLSPACQRRHHVKVVSYDRDRLPATLRDGTDAWKRIAVEDQKAGIPDLAAFRIDFAQWLRLLTDRDREIICAEQRRQHQIGGAAIRAVGGSGIAVAAEVRAVVADFPGRS